MEIKIEKLSVQEIEKRGIPGWAVWEKGPSKFPWHYDMSEQALFIQGKAIVEAYGKKYEINVGDFVTFPAGMDSEWEVVEYVRKHYNFE